MGGEMSPAAAPSCPLHPWGGEQCSPGSTRRLLRSKARCEPSYLLLMQSWDKATKMKLSGLCLFPSDQSLQPPALLTFSCSISSGFSSFCKD